MSIPAPARMLAEVTGDPTVTLTEEQASVIHRLAAGVARGNPIAIAALATTGAMLDARYLHTPPGYLAVAGLEEESWPELDARRTWLLAAIAAAGQEADLPGAQAAALALAAVLTELDIRARLYATDPDSPRWCTCGYQCRGMAAINTHLDQFPDDNDVHAELTGPPGGTADGA